LPAIDARTLLRKNLTKFRVDFRETIRKSSMGRTKLINALKAQIAYWLRLSIRLLRTSDMPF
jgi:hypothetical protein